MEKCVFVGRRHCSDGQFLIMIMCCSRSLFQLTATTFPVLLPPPSFTLHMFALLVQPFTYYSIPFWRQARSHNVTAAIHEDVHPILAWYENWTRHESTRSRFPLTQYEHKWSIYIPICIQAIVGDVKTNFSVHKNTAAVLQERQQILRACIGAVLVDWNIIFAK